MTRYIHSERLRARHDIEFVNPVTNRKNRIKKDSLVWITSIREEAIALAKINQNSGYSLYWSPADVEYHFERIDHEYIKRMES